MREGKCKVLSLELSDGRWDLRTKRPEGVWGQEGEWDFRVREAVVSTSGSDVGGEGGDKGYLKRVNREGKKGKESRKR